MKLTLKNTLIIFCLLFSLNIFANNLNGIKIFINPGHGGQDSDDRHMIATDFWESEANLTKGLYLDTLLRKLGATTQMSRIENRTEDDLALSTIRRMSNESESDIFIAIHSNGSNGTVNYVLTIFNGYTETPVVPEAKVFAINLLPELVNKGFVWSTTNSEAVGDLTLNPDFNYGYGVLYGNTVPSIISEGSFHDYIPEAWRLRSEKYCHSESHAFVRAILTHFNKPGLTKGSIAGLIRDKYRLVSYYSIPNSNDLFLPINNAKITLLPNNIVQYTDPLNNGFYFFEDLDPGNYQIIIEADNYITDTVNAVVVANKSIKLESFTEPKKSVNVLVNLTTPIELNNMLLSDTLLNDSILNDTLSAFEKFSFKFEFPMDTAKVNAAISIVPNTNLFFNWETDNRTLIIKPVNSYNPNSTHSIKIDTTAETVFGAKLKENKIINFNTDSIFNLTITKITADTIEVNNLISFRLSDRTNLEEITKYITISPNFEHKLIWSNINKILHIKPNNNLTPNNYIISFNSGFVADKSILKTKLNFPFVVKTSVTNINIRNNNNNIAIFPNPTTNNLTISNLSSNAEIKLYDLTGNLVFSKLNVTENKTNINISTLSKGIYILKIKFKDRELIKKIMKQ